VCPELALAGNWAQFQSFLVAFAKNRAKKKGDLPADLPNLNIIDFDSNGRVEEIWGVAKPVESLDATDFKAILKYFKLPIRDGPNPEDFALHEVRVLDVNQHALSATDTNLGESQKHNPSVDYELLFPVRYPGQDKIIGLKKVYLCKETKSVLEENIPSSMHSQEEDNLSRILPFPYGLDSASKMNATSVIVVSSVLDSLLLRTPKNRKKAVIALAEGSTLPPEHIPFFEPFSNITFWFPDTASSSENVSTFSRKLGEKRCSTMPRDYPQPSQYIRRPVSARPGGADLIEAIKQNSRPCSHEYITTFDTLREDVYLEFAHFEEAEGIKWKRFDKLNEYMRGFRRGELTVFSGRTGSGKTTFMSEYSVDLCMQGVNTLWGSFEVRNVRLAKMQLKQFSGVNLEEELDQFDKWADKFSKLPMYYLTFYGSEEIDKVLDAMGYAVYVYDIAHVIIDNLQFMMGSNMKSLDRYHAQDMIIGKFRKFASLHNVHITLVIHPRKEDDDRLTVNSIFGGAKATQEADNVLLLQEEEINEKLKRKFLQVVKNRWTGDLGTVPLHFNRATTTFSKKINDKEKQAKKEKKQSLSKLEEIGSETQTLDHGKEKERTDRFSEE
jgi:twinkle protein